MRSRWPPASRRTAGADVAAHGVGGDADQPELLAADAVRRVRGSSPTTRRQSSASAMPSSTRISAHGRLGQRLDGELGRRGRSPTTRWSARSIRVAASAVSSSAGLEDHADVRRPSPPARARPRPAASPGPGTPGTVPPAQRSAAAASRDARSGPARRAPWPRRRRGSAVSSISVPNGRSGSGESSPASAHVDPRPARTPCAWPRSRWARPPPGRPGRAATPAPPRRCRRGAKAALERGQREAGEVHAVLDVHGEPLAAFVQLDGREQREHLGLLGRQPGPPRRSPRTASARRASVRGGRHVRGSCAGLGRPPDSSAAIRPASASSTNSPRLPAPPTASRPPRPPTRATRPRTPPRRSGVPAAPAGLRGTRPAFARRAPPCQMTPCRVASATACARLRQFSFTRRSWTMFFTVRSEYESFRRCRGCRRPRRAAAARRAPAARAGPGRRATFRGPGSRAGGRAARAAASRCPPRRPAGSSTARPASAATGPGTPPARPGPRRAASPRPGSGPRPTRRTSVPGREVHGALQAAALEVEHQHVDPRGVGLRLEPRALAGHGEAVGQQAADHAAAEDRVPVVDPDARGGARSIESSHHAEAPARQVRANRLPDRTPPTRAGRRVPSALRGRPGFRRRVASGRRLPDAHGLPARATVRRPTWRIRSGLRGSPVRRPAPGSSRRARVRRPGSGS